MAKQLAFGDAAMREVTNDIDEQKLNSRAAGGSARAFFSSNEYYSLQDERTRIGKERAHIELQLQSFFDHYAQGASRSETSKPTRDPLKLVNDLEKGKSGFKQIQYMDAYVLGRANEYWAIIPDIIRIGHDIDPQSYMHWRPSSLECDYPDDIRPYRKEQLRVLAQRILSPTICSQGLRSKLLGTHTHGAHEEQVKAAETDGAMIYWVMLQLYHPIDRAHRRTLESDLSKIHSRFNSGDPKPVLELLQAKVQEGLDIAARIRWDTVAIPIIDTLCRRDAQFTVTLDSYRTLPVDPDDSAVELDQLVSAISDTVDQLNDAHKNWEEKAAFAAQVDKTDSLMSRISDLENQLTAYKANPNTLRIKKNALKAHVEGTCMKPGCGAKILKYRKGWKLCSTCLLKAVEAGNPITLCDGSSWTPRQAKTAMGVMISVGAMDRPDWYESQREREARAATRRVSYKREREHEEDEGSDWCYEEDRACG